MPLVNVSDTTIYYETFGNGKPLVIIPGWGTEITTILPLIEKFALDYRVIAVDNRGTGRSGKPDSPYSIEQMADDLVAVLDALEIPKAHILGLSMGGMIAQMAAAKYPGRVDRLILHVSFTRIPFLVKTLMNMMRYLPGAKKKMKEGMAVILGQKYPPTEESFRRQGEAVASFDARTILSQIRAPTLIVNASHDPFVPKKITRELTEGIPGARLVLLDGDHRVARNHPDDFMKPVLAFLEEN